MKFSDIIDAVKKTGEILEVFQTSGIIDKAKEFGNIIKSEEKPVNTDKVNSKD